MKSHNKESGSVVHIAVIVILVLAVLGFVFWQNFMNKPRASETTQTSSSIKSLEVNEWGLKGSTTQDVTGLTYKITTDTETDDNGKQYSIDILVFIPSGLLKDCQQYAGNVIRYHDANAPIITSGNGPTGTVQQAQFKSIDGYYFNSPHPQSSCGGSTTEQVDQQNAILQTSIQVAHDFVESATKL